MINLTEMKGNTYISFADLNEISRSGIRRAYGFDFGRLPTRYLSTLLVRNAVIKKRPVIFMSNPPDHSGDFPLRMETRD